MEGLGSRLGRASSRYGPTATTAVFNGPVRKWEKKWVHVAPSSPSAAAAAAAQSNGAAASSSLLLRRWTPLPLAAAGEDDVAGEPPRRKFRYTPIAVLEEQKKVVGDEPKTGEAGSSPAKSASIGGGEKDSKKETEVELDMANQNNA